MFLSLQDEIKNLVDAIISLVYYMRGAISYEEMMRRTPGERERISTFLDKRFEQEKKNPHPVY
jgi:hypothetical protein